ncbi:hypothetical protein HYX58_00430 [Candidatus Dependentiae bacterium]|nr:hypothetical protein [Candidatus Dependentiae bacterium]
MSQLFRVSLFASVIAIALNHSIKADDAANRNMAFAVGGLVASGGVKYFTDKASKKPLVKKFSEKTGVDAQDVGNVISISGGALSLSLLTNKEAADGLRQLSWRAPIAAAVAGITCTQTFQEVAKHIPVIGSAVVCANEECKGVCDRCKLTKITIAIGVYRAVDFALNMWVPTSANP